MKRKKIIVGNSRYGSVRITIEIDTQRLGIAEAENAMDSVAGEVMGLFPDIRHMGVPLVRLKVK